MLQNYINHLAFVIDASRSMSGLSSDVVKIFDDQIAYLAKRSKELDQETRVSVYLFNTETKCLFFDMDVMRLPSLKGLFNAGGGTALLDATLKSIEDLEDTSTLYGDHAFLLYNLTDGQENSSRKSAASLEQKLNSLKDNWTVAVLVPDKMGVSEATRFGFPESNIQIWEVGAKGLAKVGNVIQKSAESFMKNRALGIRGTKNLFQVDTAGLSSKMVKQAMDELKANEYKLFAVNKDSVIQPFVESWTKEDYRKGSAYYLLTKMETIQAYKEIAIQNKRNGKVYSGAAARQMLGLPNSEVKVKPDNHGEFDIFVQSTSSNRKLIGGTKLLVMN